MLPWDRPPGSKLIYLDSSVLDAVAIQNAGGRVKRMFKAHAAQGFGSVQHLFEAYRIEDTAKRVQMMQTILRVARRRETDPLMYYVLRAVLSEMRRHHPDWLEPNPDLSLINSDRKAHRVAWENLRRDLSHRPTGFLNNQQLVREVIGESRRRQMPARAAAVRGRPRPRVIDDQVLRDRLEPIVASLDPIEALWREEAGGIWWNAATGQDRQVRSLTEWLAPMLRLDRLDIESWMRFWWGEIDSAAIPVVRVEMLTQYFQAGFKVDAGHAWDILHAGYAVVTDYFLTSDTDFYEVLIQVARVRNTTVATPLLVERAQPDVAGTIAAVLGW